MLPLGGSQRRECLGASCIQLHTKEQRGHSKARRWKDQQLRWAKAGNGWAAVTSSSKHGQNRLSENSSYEVHQCILLVYNSSTPVLVHFVSKLAELLHSGVEIWMNADEEATSSQSSYRSAFAAFRKSKPPCENELLLYLPRCRATLEAALRPDTPGIEWSKANQVNLADSVRALRCLNNQIHTSSWQRRVEW